MTHEKRGGGGGKKAKKMYEIKRALRDVGEKPASKRWETNDNERAKGKEGGREATTADTAGEDESLSSWELDAVRVMGTPREVRALRIS